MNVVRLLKKISFAFPAALLVAQSQDSKVKPAFFIQLIPEMQKIQTGNKLRVKALITSTTDIFDMSARGATIGCSGADLVHVEMVGGKEPEKTERYRHLLGEFRPGDRPNENSGSCFARELRSGGTLPTTYDLSYFYQLSTPGRYDVWVQINDEVRDPIDGTIRTYPVRSNIAHFDLLSGR